jgi:uncharacterized protein (TIRG00374 family)
MAKGQENLEMSSEDMDENTAEEDSGFLSLRKLILFVLFAVVVYLVLAWYASFDAVVAALSSIAWWWVLPTMMLLSLFNYVIRYVKWQYFLQRIDVHIRAQESFLVFLAGFTLTATPGKIGEAVKGIFCRDIAGTPIAKTVPIVISERVTDLLAMMLLATLGYLLGFNLGNQLLLMLSIGAIVVGCAVVLGNKRFYQKIIMRMTKVEPLRRFQESYDLIEDTMTKTLSPKSMLLTSLVSIPGWFMECIELWLLLSLLTGAGLPALTSGSLILLAQATFIHAGASVVGAVLVFLPGGLGGYEGFAQTVMQGFMGLAKAVAFAAIIIVRFVTLWFSVIVGFVALGALSPRRRRKHPGVHSNLKTRPKFQTLR